MELLKTVKTITPIGNRPVEKRPLFNNLLKCAAIVVTGMAALVSPDISQAQSSSLAALSGFGPMVSAVVHDVNALTLEEAYDKSFPVVELGYLDSHVGEEQTAFLLRVGKILHTFTDRTGHEACGAIMQSETISNGSSEPTYRVNLITNRSQVSCLRVIYKDIGFTYTGKTIHSHPFNHTMDDHFIHANSIDQRMVGFTCGRRLKIFDGDFSPLDLQNGGGYLVARGKLLYQDASMNGSIEIGVIDMSGPLSYLSTHQSQSLTGSLASASRDVWFSPQSQSLPSTKCNDNNQEYFQMQRESLGANKKNTQPSVAEQNQRGLIAFK